ncbi:hypothetical protein BJF95_14785 [Rhizobium oryziradicis]|uniref:Uncharacterized protein n=1 Tax=Rhizobium oryziradicis TaxID=1867956 RepID=A0A1Q8ZVL7_9HYPH|nr:hypothetical protein BJF95_14785 [Rhizobium oryziradicis]
MFGSPAQNLVDIIRMIIRFFHLRKADIYPMFFSKSDDDGGGDGDECRHQTQAGSGKIAKNQNGD